MEQAGGTPYVAPALREIPVAAGAIAAHGVAVDLVPEHPKMGYLIATLGPALAAR